MCNNSSLKAILKQNCSERFVSAKNENLYLKSYIQVKLGLH